jgi:hypothetical protein
MTSPSQMCQSRRARCLRRWRQAPYRALPGDGASQARTTRQSVLWSDRTAPRVLPLCPEFDDDHDWSADARHLAPVPSTSSSLTTTVVPLRTDTPRRCRFLLFAAVPSSLDTPLGSSSARLRGAARSARLPDHWGPSGAAPLLFRFPRARGCPSGNAGHASARSAWRTRLKANNPSRPEAAHQTKEHDNEQQ